MYKDSKIDVFLIKYFGSEYDEEYYNNLFVELRKESILNIINFDNTVVNRGLTYARNRMLETSRNKVICFLELDIEIESMHWHSIYDKVMEEEVGMIDSVQKRFSTVDEDEEWQEKEYLPFNTVFMRRSVIEKIGGWDEDYFVAYADWDLFKKVKQENLKILQHNLSVIEHPGLSRHNPNKGEIWRKDFHTFLDKWGEEGQLDRTKK